MSTTKVKTVQRTALAAIALVTAAGSAVEARAATVRVAEVPKDAQNSTATTAQVSAKSRQTGN